ncbi:MAG: zinc ABC transporter substrate-binding protein [Proteobacteria bacterium]|nr:zinc ABC transporter substrate-binding protein [Pseudomonadota bacterium]
MRNRLVLFALLLFYLGNAIGAPKVVVTIKPLHGLVSAIMQGVAEPALLLPDNASPHTFALKPSNWQQLQKATLIMWVGPSLELFMQAPLKEIKPQYGVITLMEIPTLTLLPQRNSRQWQHAHEEDHEHASHMIDPHFWLDTDNAVKVIDYVENYLSKIDNENAIVYKKNASTLRDDIIKLKSTLNQKLQPVHDKPFLVYHDGYQYFEKEFNLNAVGTFILNPHVPQSAKGLYEAKTLIHDKGVKCVFRETEFYDTNIERLLSEAGVKFTELDPLGARVKAGPGAYQEILLNLAQNMQSCLAS